MKRFITIDFGLVDELENHHQVVLTHIRFRASYAEGTGWCIDSKEDISAWYKIGRTTVFKIIKELEKEGYIERNSRGDLRHTSKADSFFERSELTVQKLNGHRSEIERSHRSKIERIRENNIRENKSDKKSKPKKEIILKEKEQKNTYLQYVKLYKKEYLRLVKDFGKEVSEEAIKILNDYIGKNPASLGKKYKNHNLVIRKWPIEEALMETLSRDPEALFKQILKLATEDQIWWQDVKKRCHLGIVPKEEVKDRIRDWAYQVCLKNREVLKRREDTLNSLQHFLMKSHKFAK